MRRISSFLLLLLLSFIIIPQTPPLRLSHMVGILTVSVAWTTQSATVPTSSLLYVVPAALLIQADSALGGENNAHTNSVGSDRNPEERQRQEKERKAKERQDKNDASNSESSAGSTSQHTMQKPFQLD